MKRFRFAKYERLKRNKWIQELFVKKSSSVFLYPFKIFFHFVEKDPGAAEAWPQLLFSVGKKNFKRANKRNRIKRQMREIYRQHKHLLEAHRTGPGRLVLGVVFVGKETVEYSYMQKRLCELLTRIPTQSA